MKMIDNTKHIIILQKLFLLVRETIMLLMFIVVVCNVLFQFEIVVVCIKDNTVGNEGCN